MYTLCLLGEVHWQVHRHEHIYYVVCSNSNTLDIRLLDSIVLRSSYYHDLHKRGIFVFSELELTGSWLPIHNSYAFCLLRFCSSFHTGNKDALAAQYFCSFIYLTAQQIHMHNFLAYNSKVTSTAHLSFPGSQVADKAFINTENMTEKRFPAVINYFMCTSKT